MKLNQVFFLLFLLFFLSSNSPAQYFQQEVNYKIAVSLNDKTHELSAFVTFEYRNRSPHTLTEIYIHLWPNAYKDKNTALSMQVLQNGSKRIYFAEEKNRGYIDSLHFKADGKDAQWIPDINFIDYGRLILNTPLKPGEQVTISTPFHIKIPSGKLSRFGHTGQAYSITQWYPKPAVYDINGWHPMPYLEQGEFYSEFGSFEVRITIPKNYVVGATGDLQNEEELKWLEQKAEETAILTSFDKTMLFPKSSSETKTLVYKQSNVHDFAWFADKRYHVLKGSVELPHTGKKVTTWAMFTNSEPLLWKKSLDYMHDAIYYYSLWTGDYPYAQYTAVDGTIAEGSGMEYPNITVIGKSGHDLILESSILHEVGHNWFYGILGSNEREHAWMDEGINSFYEIRYLMMKYNNDSSKYKNQYGGILRFAGKITGISDLNSKEINYLAYLYSARNQTDQAIINSSAKFTAINYGTMVYSKASLGLNYLRNYLGDELFDSCMVNYFNKWQFKHPCPDDFSQIFVERTGKDLNWFFHDFLQTTKKCDYKISQLRRIYGDSFINPIAKGYVLKVTNSGQLASPFSVSTLKNGKIISTQWYDGFKGTDTLSVSCEQCDRIKIDASLDIPETNRQNNSYRTRGMFRDIEKLSFPFFLRVENPDRTQISWLPVLGWNNYDKTMIGLALHNLSFTNKNFEYALAPMLSTGAKQLSGSGTLSYTIYPEKSDFEHVNFSVSGSRFSYLIDNYRTKEKNLASTHLSYEKLNGEIRFKFKNNTPRSPWNKSVTVRSLNLWKDQVSYNRLPDSSYGGSVVTKYQYHNQMIFSFINYRTLDPYQMRLTFEQNPDFFKGSVCFNYTLSYKKKNKGLDFRLFLGGFLVNLNNTGVFHLTGTGNTQTGNEDYLFDNLYLGRSESKGILSKQFYEQEGAFKVYSPIGRSSKWIGTLNIKSDLPGNIPVRVFADLGIYDGSDRAYADYRGITFDAGIEVEIFKNFLEVYIPLLVSKDIDKFYKTNELRFYERIRFVFNINALGPFKLREYLSIK